MLTMLNVNLSLVCFKPMTSNKEFASAHRQLKSKLGTDASGSTSREVVLAGPSILLIDRDCESGCWGNNSDSVLYEYMLGASK